MLDLAQVEGFEWDEGNSRKSVEKHDVSQIEAEQVFFNDPLLIIEDEPQFLREQIACSGTDRCRTTAPYKLHAAWRRQANQGYFGTRYAP